MDTPKESIERHISPEVIKDPQAIVVVTATLYPQWYEGKPKQPMTVDKVRGDLAMQTLLEAKRHGFQIALVDGGSSDTFLKILKREGISFEKQKEKGPAGPARRQATEIGQNLQGVKVICQTEPEKVYMISDCLVQSAIPIIEDKADIVVPKRNEASLSTLPEYQAKAEKKANKLYNQILRKHGLLDEKEPDIDFWFAARVFANRPEVVGLFKKRYQFKPASTALHRIVQPEAYSNPIFFPIVAALHFGFRVKSVEVPYRHPPAQTEFENEKSEFNRKRDIQRRTIVTELIHLIRYLEKSKKGRLFPQRG